MIGPSEAQRKALRRNRRIAERCMAGAVILGVVTVLAPVLLPSLWAGLVDAPAVLAAMALAFLAGSYAERGVW